MKRSWKLVLFTFFAALPLLFCVSCGTLSYENVSNNDRSLRELAAYMLKKTGTKYQCDMNPGPVHAESGFSVWAGDHQVAFYKYNTERQKQKKKLDWIRENKCLYILGYKYPAMIRGSFVMIDYEETPYREKLMEAFQNF